MQKYRIIGANFQRSGCAGAHPHEALDPPLSKDRLSHYSTRE